MSFEALKNTTLPIGLDDISEKGQEMRKELVIDPYNNTSRGVKHFPQFSLLTGIFHKGTHEVHSFAIFLTQR